MEKTFGQELVGKDFSPSKNPVVDRVKDICAELADIVNNHDGDSSYLYNLVKGSALREILLTQMNVVKLITLPKQG